MLQCAGEAAFVTAGTSGIATGLAAGLLTAGARVALAGADEPGLATTAAALRRSGGTVTAVRLDVGDEASWIAAADAAEKILGPISIVCNVADEAGGGATDDGPFRVCRWTDEAASHHPLAAHTFNPRLRGRDVRPHVLNTGPVSRLVAMGLLIPGSVSARVGCTAGVAEAGADGLWRNQQRTGHGQVIEASSTEVGRQILDALPENGYLIATHREWTCSNSRTRAFSLFPV